jgi:hypothetical protein
MLFTRRATHRLSNWGPLREIAWDDETVRWIAESDRLNVRVTHISKTVSFGQMGTGLGFRHPLEWLAHGVMTYPKFIPVNVTFTGADDQFGVFAYNILVKRKFKAGEVNLPLLDIWLSDREGEKAQQVYSALHDAIMSREKFAEIRFFKEKGQGLMTEIDRLHGYSYESRHTILGMVIWPTLQAHNLPMWAVPTDQHKFSLDALPKQRSDLDRELDVRRA